MMPTPGGFQEGHFDLGDLDLRNRRRGVALLVIGTLAVALFLWLVPLGGDSGYHHRTSRSSASMGFRGLHELLGRLGKEVHRHRRPYGELPRADRSALLLFDPFDHTTLRKHGRARFDHEQWSDLHDWVRAGGHALVVLPTWEATELGEGWGETRLRPNAARAVLEPPPPGEWAVEIPDVDDGSWLHRSWFPVGADPMLYAFDDDMGTIPTPMAEWLENRKLFAPYWGRGPGWATDDEERGPFMQYFSRPLPEGYEMRAQLGSEPLLLRRRIGDGEVWVLSSGWPVSNMALARGNTAWFVYKMLEEVSSGFRRDFVFDEFSHGDSDARGMFGWLIESGAVYPILAMSILFLLAGWRGQVRVGAPMQARLLPRRAKEEFVVGLASLLHSQDRRRFVGRSLVEEGRHRLESRPGWSASERKRRLGELSQVEAALESAARLSYPDLRRLAEAVDRLLQTKEARTT